MRQVFTLLAIAAGCGDSSRVERRGDGPRERGQRTTAPEAASPPNLSTLSPGDLVVPEEGLPDGWAPAGSGKWLKRSTASQVVVYVQQNAATADEVAVDTLEGVEQARGSVTEGPVPARLLGEDGAQRLRYTRSMRGGVSGRITEHYLSRDGTLIIAAGVVFPTGIGDGDEAEVRDLIEAIRVAEGPGGAAAR